MADAIFLACPRIRLAVYVATTRAVKGYIDELPDGDRAAVIEMTAALQGREQAELVASWMRRQPSAFQIIEAGVADSGGSNALMMEPPDRPMTPATKLSRYV